MSECIDCGKDSKNVFVIPLAHQEDIILCHPCKTKRRFKTACINHALDGHGFSRCVYFSIISGGAVIEPTGIVKLNSPIKCGIDCEGYNKKGWWTP